MRMSQIFPHKIIKFYRKWYDMYRQGSEFQGIFKTTTKMQDFTNHVSIKQDYFQTPHKDCNQSTQMAFNKFQKVSASL